MMTRQLGPLQRLATVGYVAFWLLAPGLSQGSEVRQALSLPPVQVFDVHGASHVLTQFTGKPTVVNLWATWCPPCQREMPVIARTQEKHKEVDFVLLNQGEGVNTVQTFLQLKGLKFQYVLLDRQSKMLKLSGSRGLPVTLVFDAQGVFVAEHEGEVTAAELSELVSRATGTSSGHSDLRHGFNTDLR